MNYRIPQLPIANQNIQNSYYYGDSPYQAFYGSPQANVMQTPKKIENYHTPRIRNSYIDTPSSLSTRNIQRVSTNRNYNEINQIEPDYRDNIFAFNGMNTYRNQAAIRVENPGEIYLGAIPKSGNSPNVIHRHTRSLGSKPSLPIFQNPIVIQNTPPVVNPYYLKMMMDDNNAEDQLMFAVKKQNLIIGKLADQLGEQHRQQYLKEKYDMEEKLRLLELEQALRREEHNIRMKEKIEERRRQDRLSLDKKKKKKDSDVYDLISKMLLIQEFGKQNNSDSRAGSAYDQSRKKSTSNKDRLPPIKKKKKVTKIYMKSNPNEDYEDQGSEHNYEDDDNESTTSRSTRYRDSDGFKTPKNKKKKKGDTILIDKKNKELAQNNKLARSEAKKRLKGLLWGITYPQLLFGYVKSKVESRKKEIQNQMEQIIQINFNIAVAFIIKYAEAEIVKLVQTGKSLELYVPGKQLNEKDFDMRAEIIIGNYKRLFDKICFGTKKANFHPNFLRFLAFISEDQGVLPSGFMFDFELKRFQFTYYATLKNMTTVMSKMVIGCFFLLRILLHKLIMRPWENLQRVTEKSVDKKSLLSIGSLLYHTVLDLFRGTVPTHKDNQSFLPPELKIKPAQTQLTALKSDPYEDEGNEIKTSDKGKEQEPIKGFYTKDMIAPFFKNKKNDELKKIIEGWLEQMYQLTHELYKETSKEERETLGLPK